jgi:flavin reductase (DIM6/NTAB) family NADH-FMN oxidoreductase RutF
MRRYPTGVTVVTIRHGKVDHGMTANSITTLSLDPPLMLVCVRKTARAHDIMREGGHFVVNLLAYDQAEVSRIFADESLTDDERWATVTTQESTIGGLRIDGCMGYLDCKITDAFDGGTHTIYIGEVVKLDEGEDKTPLIFHGAGYRELAPPNP